MLNTYEVGLGLSRQGKVSSSISGHLTAADRKAVAVYLYNAASAFERLRECLDMSLHGSSFCDKRRSMFRIL